MEVELKDDSEFEAALREIAAAPPVDPRHRRPLEPGDVVDGTYRVERVLGAGGMGVVYRAWDLALDRPVALKLRLADGDPHHLERLWREARVMARLSHPNVVTIYEVGRWRGHLFIAMEHIEGGTARSWLASRPRTWREIVALYVQAAGGLMAAHRAGIIHRDFKPDNVLVEVSGTEGEVRPVVADFGLARPSEIDATFDERTVRDDRRGDPPGAGASGRLTHTGATLGTRGYMAPEQLRAGGVDERADQFAFCVSLYEALCGRLPFDVEAASPWSGGPRLPPPGRDVPPHVWRALERGLRIDPADRWPHLQELVEALQDDPAARRRGRMWLMTGGIGVVALGGSAYAAGRSPAVDCTLGEAKIAEVWNEATRRALGHAFEATGSPLATNAAQRAAAGLDAYATAWVETYRSVCQATHHEHAQSEAVLDRQMACLERRARGLEALVDAFVEHVDAGSVERASDAVDGLEAAETCGRIVATQTVVEPPPIGAEAQAEEIRSDLAEARALRLTGRVDDGAKRDRALLDRAEALGYLPLVAEVRAELGEALMDLGRERALDELRRAHFDAVAVGDDRLAATTATSLINAPVLRRNTHAEALEWFDVAEAFHRRVGTAQADKGILLAARGSANLVARRLDEARADLEAALGLVEGGLRARVLSNLSYLHQEQADYQEALRLREQALAESIAVYGEDHPAVANIEEGLAVIYGDLGKTDEAKEASRRSIERWRRSVGPDSPRLLEAYNKRAVLLVSTGDRRGALAEYLEALDVLERTSHEEVELRADLEANIGSVLVELEEYDRALPYLQHAAELMKERLGPDDHKIGILELTLGHMRGMQGDADAATAHIERGVGILRASLGDRHPHLAVALLNLGSVQMAAGRLEAAGVTLDEAATIAEAAFAEPGRPHAQVAMSRARLRRLQERWADAAQEGERCAEILTKIGNENSSEWVQCTLENGRARARSGDRDAARAVLEEALARIESGTHVVSGTVASVRFELAQVLPASERRRAIELARGAVESIDPDDADPEGRRAAMVKWLASRGVDVQR